MRGFITTVIKAIQRLPTTITLLLVCTVIITPQLNAEDIRFKHFNNEDGLPSNELYALIESNDGYLWIGSKAGITRFDGLNFKSLLHGSNAESTLPGISVQSLLMDSKDRLWVGLETGGLVQVDNHLNITRHLTSGSTPLQLPTGTVWSMAEDCDGNIWLGFSGHGIARLNVENNTLERIPIIISDKFGYDATVLSLHLDQHCKVWAGLVENSLLYWNADKDNLIQINNQEWLTHNTSVQSITDYQGKLYASGKDQVGIFDSTTGAHIDNIDIKLITGLDKLSIRSLAIHEGILWGGTSDGLFSIQLSTQTDGSLDPQTSNLPASTSKFYQHQEALTDSLASNNIRYVTTGKQGNLWLATQDNGLVYQPPGWGDFSLIQRNPLQVNHLPNNNISTTAATSEHLWLGMLSAGAARFSIEQQQLDTPALIKNLPFLTVWAIHQDKTGITWLAGISQIAKYLNGSDPIEVHLPETITQAMLGIRPLAFIELDDALWLIAKHQHLMRYDLNTQNWQLYAVEQSDQVITFTHYQTINEHQFLVSSETHLYLYDATSDQFKVLLDAGSEIIQQMTFDHQRQLWIAFKNHISRYRFDTQGLTKTLQLRYPNTLHNTTINNLDFDAYGQLWFGTLNGLFKLPSTLNNMTDNSQPDFLHLTRDDGLPSTEITENTLTQISDGRMAVGSNKGAILFDPQTITEKTGQPDTDITIFRTITDDLIHQLNDQQAFNFEYNNNTLSIGFNAVTFNYRNNLNYQYQLSGWDADWINTSQIPQITYSQLKPGHYRFMVRARIGLGQWGKSNQSLSFTIVNPPWKTGWAYIVYALALLSLLLLFWQHYQRNQLRRQALLQARERQQFAEIQTRIATDFASALHYQEIANALSTTLKQSMAMVRMLVHFQDTNEPVHRFIYDQQLDKQLPLDIDFDKLYEGFSNNPGRRFYKQTIELKDTLSYIQLNLPLGSKRPVQAIVSLHFSTQTPPLDSDIAAASLVAQMAETAVRNTNLLEQLSQLAALNQRANEAKSEFISTVSHEIRTPLHGLMGMLDLLNQSESEQQRTKLLGRLTDSSEQLLSVVDDVLDISKIEANKVELSQDTFELSHLIEQTNQLFIDQASTKNLNLVL